MLQLEEFKKDSERFCYYGKSSFLSIDDEGDSETFYCHVLRFYLYDVAIDALNAFGVGLGVWTMKIFENLNKESKRMSTDCTNQKGEVSRQSIQSLFKTFKHNMA